MKMVVNYDILPMLREYWFDERERLAGWERRLKGVLETKIGKNKVNREDRVVNKRQKFDRQFM